MDTDNAIDTDAIDTDNEKLVELIKACWVDADQSCKDDEIALLKVLQLLSENKSSWNWIGIYLLIGDTLVLGPYIGKHTDHTRIPVGTGVCGSAVAADQNIMVEDVREVGNYLACSLETRSEIVVLIRHNGQVVGQFDIDSDEVGAFGAEDEQLLQTLGHLVARRCHGLAQALARSVS